MPTSERTIPLGKIVSTHGLDGWVKLNPYNPESRVFRAPLKIILENDEARVTFDLESSRPHKRQILLKLRGIDTIEEAEKWVGFALAVAEQSLPRLAPGEYFHYQVIGLDVFDIHGQHIGVVARTLATLAGEIYVVSGKSKEHLIPAVREFIDEVDLAAGKIIINPPSGLLDL